MARLSDRDAARKLYASARWKATRLAQLADEPLCRMCAQVGRTTAATIVDHLEPHRGDPEAFWASPLQSVCKPCHDRHAQRRDRGGDIRAIGADGWPIG